MSTLSLFFGALMYIAQEKSCLSSKVSLRLPCGLGLKQEGKSGRNQQKRGEAEEGKTLGNQACAPAAVREGEE